MKPRVLCTITLLCTVACAGTVFAQTRDFAGLKFGVGLSFTSDTGKNDRVDDAVIDANGVVRVNKTNNALARVVLESHYFFTTRRDWLGFGPFVAIQPGSDEIINAIGAGVMVGFRRPKSETNSFNIGVGFIVDPSTKILGTEFVADKPAPLGPDGKALPIRFMTRDQTGILGMASFSW
jgi:hypothetical protein